MQFCIFCFLLEPRIPLFRKNSFPILKNARKIVLENISQNGTQIFSKNAAESKKTA